MNAADQALPTVTGPVLDRAVLAYFAGGSGDLNPLHLDVDFARGAGLDDVIAHGMLSMAVLGRVLTTWTTQDRIRSFRARFTAPTPVGARPVGAGRVVAVEDVDGERRARIELTVSLDDGTVTLAGEAVVAVS